jgi:hypothetical protein
VTLVSRWVTLRARWVTLVSRWVTLRASWVTLRARWVTLRASWVTFTAEGTPRDHAQPVYDLGPKPTDPKEIQVRLLSMRSVDC